MSFKQVIQRGDREMTIEWKGTVKGDELELQRSFAGGMGGGRGPGGGGPGAGGRRRGGEGGPSGGRPGGGMGGLIVAKARQLIPFFSVSLTSKRADSQSGSAFFCFTPCQYQDLVIA